MEYRLNEVSISITNACNLHCVMCQTHVCASCDELSTDEMMVLIDDAIALRPRVIVLSGGEPLMRSDVFDLVSYIGSQGVKTSLISNGTLMTDDVVHRLSRAGVGGVNISIEGEERSHDSIRGKGNYNKAVEAVKNLVRHHIDVTLATTVSALNYADIPAVIQLAHQVKASTVWFQPFGDFELIDKTLRDRFYIPRERRCEVDQVIWEVIRLSKEFRITTNPEGYLKRIPSYLCDELARGASQKGCTALWNACAITATGDVLPCWPLNKRFIGNVKKKRLIEIWDSKEHRDCRCDIEQNGCHGCMLSSYNQSVDNGCRA